MRLQELHFHTDGTKRHLNHYIHIYIGVCCNTVMFAKLDMQCCQNKIRHLARGRQNCRGQRRNKAQHNFADGRTEGLQRRRQHESVRTAATNAATMPNANSLMGGLQKGLHRRSRHEAVRTVAANAATRPNAIALMGGLQKGLQRESRREAVTTRREAVKRH